MNSKGTLRKKNILLISYYFPPNTAVGGLRIAHFARYLPLYGWNSYVLTIKDRYLEDVDYSRLEGMPPETIFKAGKLPTLLGMYLFCKKCAYWILKKTPSLPAQEISSAQLDGAHLSETVSRRLKRYILSFLVIPDGDRNWILPGLFKAVRLIKEKKVDCILTSGPPHSNHIIGLLAKMTTGVKWVADYRDPWTTYGSKPLMPECELSMQIERWIEKNVVRKADLILTTTGSLSREFQEWFKDEPADKFLMVSNGFDKDFFSQFEHIKKYETFTVSYAGNIYYVRTPELAFRAVQELIQERKIGPGEIRVKLVGNCRYAKGLAIDRMVQDYHLEEIVEIIDPVPYSQALELIKRSHLALLLAPDQPTQIPAKLFDYMGLGTTVLALAQDGETASLIRSTGIGEIFHPADLTGVKEFIYESFMKRHAPKPKSSPEILNQFERKAIIKRMAGHLEMIYAPKPDSNKPAVPGIKI